jgi:hypothetical protein
MSNFFYEYSTLNLFHVCTNSYAVSGNTSSIKELSELHITGRVEIVSYLSQKFPSCLNDKTKTSAGEETFAEIVRRLYQKNQAESLPTSNAGRNFDRNLFSQLIKLCSMQLGTELESSNSSSALCVIKFNSPLWRDCLFHSNIKTRSHWVKFA